MSELFNVWWWDRDGGQHRELQFVEPDRAVKAAYRLTHGPASAFAVVDRVIITDGGDLTCFEWTKAEGLTFPKRRKDQQ